MRKKYAVSTTELQRRLRQQKKEILAHHPSILIQPQQLKATLETRKYSRWIVENWRKGWLWLSNWIFILIAWVAYNGIPNEFLVLIPEANRANVIPILSALGVICRFINQSRKKPLPEVKA